MRLRLETKSAKRLVWTAVGLAWIGAGSVGFAMLANYANSPGPRQQGPIRWPGGREIPLSKTGPTLIFFAHPRCPCTRASIGELEKIVARCPGSATVWIVFFRPGAAPDDWDRGDLWDTAGSIPGVHVLRDADGALAQRFDVLTSGQTLLFSPGGELLFSGGITFARGHAGDNAGRTAIESYLAGRSPRYSHSPVFGCSISAPSEQEP